MSSYHSYPSIFNLGHRYIADLLLDPVLVEEKVDGSQISFGKFAVVHEGVTHYDLRMRSKGAELNILAPKGMFKKAVDYVQSIAHMLTPEWTYRGEYLAKPKHNVLAYDRVPNNHIIIFDINTEEETYLDMGAKHAEATRIGLEVVTPLFYGIIESPEKFRQLLDTTSILGGQKIEGVVIKNYARFGQDKKVLLGKFVSEAFKEVHKGEWRAANPSTGDIITNLVNELKTPARWDKAIHHLRDAGQLEGSPKDIGLLMKEVPADIEKEEMEYIKQKLFDYAWPQIRRGVTAGLPQWYKEELMKLQFEQPVS